MTKLPFLLAGAGVVAFALTRKSSPSLAQTAAQVMPPQPLDIGLTIDENLAVQKALTVEKDPKNLQAFAATFDPQYPIAASILRAQAMLITPASAAPPGPMTGGVFSDDACCDGCKTGCGPCDDSKPIATGKAVGPNLPFGLSAKGSVR